jgi:hypothetical protein
VSFAGRLRQGFAALRPREPDDLLASVQQALTPEQAGAFRSLPIYDRVHLFRVFARLRDEGVDDPDLLTAALLHDLGKCALGGRVRLIDRTIAVLLGRLSPRLLVRLAALPAPDWRLGIALAVHHPELGAEWASELGCSPRTVWLIAHHADDPLPDDADLARLVRADRTV